MDKENMVYIYKRILFSLIKQADPAIRHNMNSPGGQYAKWSKPVTEGQIWHDSIEWGMQNSQTQKQRVKWLPGAGGGRNRSCSTGIKLQLNKVINS